MVQLQVQYQGRVQGVGFRATVRDAAGGFQVGGWVRNEHDGSVTLVVQGEESEVEGLLEEVQRRLGRFITGAERLRRPIDESLRVAGIEIRR